MSKLKTIESVFPISSIKDDLLLMRNGDYAIGYKLDLCEIFTIGEKGLVDVHNLWGAILKSAPENIVLHKQDWFESNHYKPDFSEHNIIDRSIEFHFCEKPFIVQSAYLYVIQANRDTSKNKRTNGSFFSRNLLSKNITDERKFSEFKTFCRTLESIINTSNLIKCQRLYKKDYLTEQGGGLLNKFANLSDDCVMRDMDFRNENFITVGQKKGCYFSISKLNQFPDEFTIASEKNNHEYPFSSMYAIGLGLKVNHIYNQVFFKDDQANAYNKLNKKRAGMKSFAKASPDNSSNAAGILAFMEEKKDLIRFHGNVFTWAESESALINNLMEVSSAFTSIGFIVKEERINNINLHWSSFPGAAASEIPADLTCTMKFDQAATLITNEANYESSVGDYGIKLMDMQNRVPLLVDITNEPFNKSLINNKNLFFVGGSGAGKSVLTNEILRVDLKAGNHVLIADIGGSYERQCLLMGDKGVYLKNTDDQPLSFNPFYVSSLKELHNEKLFFINKTIFTCAGLILEENNTAANVMEKVLLVYYEYCFKNDVFLCMNTFYEFIKMYKEKLEKAGRKEVNYLDFDMLLINLEKFTTGGRYQHLLNSRTNIDLMSKQIIVFDMDTVKNDKTLFTLITLMIMSTMIDKIFRMEYILGKDASSKILKRLVLDEAWKALMNETMADFIKYAAKTFRKLNGSLFLITQEPDDLLSNPTMATTLLGNCATKIIGDLSGLGDKIEPVLKMFELPTHEMLIVKGLNQVQNLGMKLRKFFIKTGALGRVYGFSMTPEQDALYSTTPDVVASVTKQLNKYNGNVGLAIQEHVAISKQLKLQS